MLKIPGERLQHLSLAQKQEKTYSRRKEEQFHIIPITLPSHLGIQQRGLPIRLRGEE